MRANGANESNNSPLVFRRKIGGVAQRAEVVSVIYNFHASAIAHLF